VKIGITMNLRDLAECMGQQATEHQAALLRDILVSLFANGADTEILPRDIWLRAVSLARQRSGERGARSEIATFHANEIDKFTRYRAEVACGLYLLGRCDLAEEDEQIRLLARLQAAFDNKVSEWDFCHTWIKENPIQQPS
jgi:hypothetical protein